MYISGEICVYIISFQGFILNLSVYLDTDLISLNHMDVAFCSGGCAVKGNNSHILEALTSAGHVSKLMGDSARQLRKFPGRKQQLHLCSKEAGKLPARF